MEVYEAGSLGLICVVADVYSILEGICKEILGAESNHGSGYLPRAAVDQL